MLNLSQQLANKGSIFAGKSGARWGKACPLPPPREDVRAGDQLWSPPPPTRRRVDVLGGRGEMVPRKAATLEEHTKDVHERGPWRQNTSELLHRDMQERWDLSLTWLARRSGPSSSVGWEPWVKPEMST